MTAGSAEVWTVIALLGLGTFLIRFSFLGFWGSRSFPDWLLRHLRYTPVAVMPGLVAPLIFFPGAGSEVAEPTRFAVAAAALAAGYFTRQVLWGVIAGGVTFWLMGLAV